MTVKWWFSFIYVRNTVGSISTRFMSQQYNAVGVTWYLCLVSIKSLGSYQFVEKTKKWSSTLYTQHIVLPSKG